jgi:magnesium chelatase family protein
MSDYKLTITEHERDAAMVGLAKKIVEAPGPMCLIGPPGCGKTITARRVVEAMDSLTDPETVRAVGQIRYAMRLPELGFLDRPFRAPHHTISHAALAGRRPDPITWFPCYGELSLAHGGVLFLDELPEFSRSSLEVVFNAMRDKAVTHDSPTGNAVYTYPADFKLIAAMNPCPCGYAGHPTRKCECSPKIVSHYLRRVKAILDKCTVIYVGAERGGIHYLSSFSSNLMK